MQAVVEKAKLAELVMLALERFEADLREVVAELNEDAPAPNVDESAFMLNDLDKLSQTYREACLAELLDKASTVKNTATDVSATLAELEVFLKRFSALTIEVRSLIRISRYSLSLLSGVSVCLAAQPQNSIPDLVIWLISGSKRIAYARIPANQVFYTDRPECRGELCGKISTIFLKVFRTRLGSRTLRLHHFMLSHCCVVCSRYSRTTRRRT